MMPKILLNPVRGRCILQALGEERGDWMPDDQVEIEQLRSLVTRFAARLGISGDDAKALDIAASMLGVKRLPIMDILKKDAPLTPEDRERMKENADVWAEFAEKVDLLRELGVAEYLEKYTEHWDGSGRPAGLAGDDIPLGARILGLCYHYNGMVSDRPYRRALTTKRALAEIARLSGTVLDPDLVTLFVAAVQDERKSSRAESRREAREPDPVEPEAEKPETDKPDAEEPEAQDASPPPEKPKKEAKKKAKKRKKPPKKG
jgi:HD-GYP domain-containing protein (c-di-GMP phosphodiesterase class II)